MPPSVTTHPSFFAPREVLSGTGASGAVSTALARWGVQGGTVLVVRDAVVAEHGLAQALLDDLEAAGFHSVTFDGITAEPTLEVAEAALRAARESGAGVVVGMGGGSTMDVAKVAAAFAAHDCDVRAVAGGHAADQRCLPLVLVPTTAGTGAETSRVSMVSIDGHKQILISPFFVPLVAVLDADLIHSLPQPVTASGGLDAVAHALEAYISTNATALTDSAARSAVSLLATALPQAWANGDDLDARAATLEGAHLAGRSLNAGVVVGHSIAYTIADRVHLPHGITTGMALPYALAYSLPVVDERLTTLSASLAPLTGGTTDGLLSWLQGLSTSLGAPGSLAEAGLDRSDVAGMTEDVLTRYPRPNNPVPLEADRLNALMGHFHDGDLTTAVAAMTS